MTFDRMALYGKDHAEPNVFAMHGLASGEVWCALSVGGAAVLRRKGDAGVPNEDALYVVEEDARVLLAVADAHFGHEASHELIERLAELLDGRAHAARGSLPANEHELRALLSACAEPPTQAWMPRAPGTGAAAYAPAGPAGPRRGRSDAVEHRARSVSETTFVVAVVDRVQREAFGVAAGDSSCVAIDPEKGVRWLTRPSRAYATPRSRWTLVGERVASFRAALAPGELVVLFTDGVNECHYGEPATSVGTAHLESLAVRAAGRVESFVEGLAALALSGVGGSPGGEDNLAIAATRVR